MNFHNNNQIKSRTIGNRNNQKSFRKKKNKISKSQTFSNILKFELIIKRMTQKKSFNQ